MSVQVQMVDDIKDSFFSISYVDTEMQLECEVCYMG